MEVVEKMIVNYLDLFSGVGGFHEGLRHAGFKFGWTGHAEINKYAKSIYQKHFPESEDLGDVTDINVSRLPRAEKWVVTGGWPCQDNSIAGKRQGQSGGTRSGLLSQIVRILGEIIDLGAEVVFVGENVKGLYSVNEGIDFINTLRWLTFLDKDSPQLTLEMQLLNTRWFLPQNRERIYFVGYSGKGNRQQIFPIGEGGGRINETQGKRKRIRGNDSQVAGSLRIGSGDTKDLIQTANCMSARYYKDGSENLLQVSTLTEMRTEEAKEIRREIKDICPTISTSAFEHNNHVSGIRRLTPTEAERLQGFPDDWTKYGKDGEEISDTQRYKCLGNAVSVPVVKAVAGNLLINCE